MRVGTAPLPGEIPRDDLAALFARVLRDARASQRILYVSRGSEPLDEALEMVLTKSP